MPPLFLILVVLSLAVPVPYFDEWRFVPLVDKFWKGQLTFWDLLAQHNEHRLLFPRLLMLFLARLTGWDIRYELGVNIALGICIFGMIAWQIRRTAREVGFPQLAWSVPACSVIVFSVSQFENWLWGFQIAIMLNLLTVTAALLLLAQPDFRWWRLATASLLGLISTHSFASGILLWPLGLAVLAVGVRGQKAWTAIFIWGVLSSFGLASFFWRYHLPANHQPLDTVFFRPTDFGGYVLRFLGAICAQFQGATIGGNDGIAIVSGLLFLISSAWSVQFLLRRKVVRLATLLPYLALMGYGILSACMTAVGRSALGNHQAISSRYCTLTVPLWIALVVLLMLTTKDSQSQSLDLAGHENRSGSSGPGVRETVGALVGFIIGLLMLSSAFGVSEARKLSWRQERGRRALLSLVTSNAKTNSANLMCLYPDPNYILTQYPVLVKHRLACCKNVEGH